MLTIDILISATNQRIVRIKDLLLEEAEGVHYVVSYQYSDDKFLSLIPPPLETYADVVIDKNKGKGLSKSRNRALELAQNDLVYFIDDDTVLIPEAIDVIRKTFEENPDVDIALFQAQTYAGAPLRDYPREAKEVTSFRDRFPVLAYEMVCRREKVQGILKYDTRFGLGSGRFLCYEQQVWLEDALRAGLKIKYFPSPIIKTSAIYKPLLLLMDSHVQQALGGLLAYVYKAKAPVSACHFAYYMARKGKRNFFSVLKSLMQGIFLLNRR